MLLNIEQAIQRLNAGDVIGLPTETVYGLAASLRFPEAIERIFSLKNRPQDNPLIIHISHLDQLLQFHPEFPPGFELLAKLFWPGPLTIVLPIDPQTIPEKVRAGLSTAAFRIPSGILALEVIENVGPIVMPSANISGTPSATKPEHVETDFGKDFPVLDGGFCARGLESTILIYGNGSWQIARQGALSQEKIAEVLEVSLYAKQTVAQPICPGQKYRHYAPRTKLVPTQTIDPSYKGAIVGFSDKIYPTDAKLYALGSSEDPEEIARNLYSIFRQLDVDNTSNAIIDMRLPPHGVYLTIIERIQKACS